MPERLTQFTTQSKTMKKEYLTALDNGHDEIISSIRVSLVPSILADDGRRLHLENVETHPTATLGANLPFEGGEVLQVRHRTTPNVSDAIRSLSKTSDPVQVSSAGATLDEANRRNQRASKFRQEALRSASSSVSKSP